MDQEKNTKTVEEEPIKYGTVEDILGAEDRKPVPIVVPEWGGKGTTFYIRQLSAAEGLELADIVGEKNKGANVKVVIFGLCDQHSKQIFNDAHQSALKRKSMKVINEVAVKILRVNGLLKEAAQAEEDARKNE